MAESTLVDPATGVPEPRFHLPGDKTALSWATFAAPVTGVLASSTIAAGAAGVQRVITGAVFSLAPAVAVLATSSIGVYIKNGTNILWAAVVSVGSAGISPPYSVSGLNLLTSAATEVSAGFSNGVTGATEFVTLIYHDLGV